MITWLAVRAALRGAIKFLASIPWWAWLVIAVAVAAFVYGETRYRAGVAAQAVETEAARSAFDKCVAVNATNGQTIDKLQQANADWANKNAADVAAGKLAVAAVERERDALQTEVDKRRADRTKTYANDPTAGAWARTVVPASVARSLQDL